MQDAGILHEPQARKLQIPRIRKCLTRKAINFPCVLILGGNRGVHSDRTFAIVVEKKVLLMCGPIQPEAEPDPRLTCQRQLRLVPTALKYWYTEYIFFLRAT